MSRNSRDLNVNITASEEQFGRALDKARTRLTQFERDRNRAEREMRSMAGAHGAALREQEARERALAAATLEAAQKRSAAHREVAQVVTAASAAVAAGLAYSAKEALGWQSAFAGVRKTVEGTPAELEAVETGLRNLTKVLPASHEEIAGVAEAAGQLGVAQGDIVGFTKVMIDLGETTNLSADEAATSLARISNIMGTATGDVSRMGSTIVDLGNNSATTEREIVELATRLAAAGRQANLSEADIFAYASALTSVGVEAEAGGTAMSKVFTSIGDAVRDGGEQLETFARVAGVSTADFRAAFEQDAAAAIAMFVDGMGRAAASGQSTTAIFDELELTDQRLMRAILSTGSASGLLTGQLDLANSAWSENTALVKEAEQRYGTAESRIAIAKNSLQDTAITLGETFLPMIADAADGIADFADWIGQLPPGLLEAAAGIGGVVSGLGLLGGGLVLALPKLRAAHTAFRDIRTESPRVAGGLSKISKAVGLLGLAQLGVEASAFVSSLKQGAPDTRAFINDLTAMAEGAERVGDAVSEVFTNQMAISWLPWVDEVGTAEEAIQQFGRKAREALDTSVAESVDRFLGFGHDMREFEGIVTQLDDAFTGMVTDGSVDQAADLYARFTAAAVEQGVKLEDLQKHFPGYLAALEATAAESEAAASGTGAVTDGLTEVDPAAQAAADALMEADKALAEWRESAIASASGFVSLMDGFQNVIDKNTEFAQSTADATSSAEDSWEDYYDGQTVAVDDWIADLKRQVQEQKAWAENLSTLSERVNESMSGEMRDAANAMVDELFEAGPESASAVAALVDASDKELERLVRLGYIRGDEVATGLVNEIEGHRSPKVEIELDDTAARNQAQGFLTDWAGRVIPMSINATPRLVGRAQVLDAFGLASGGKVPGTPPAQPGVDNVLAMTERGRALKVRSGEWVINEQQSTKQDRVLRMINSGVDVQKLVGLASGGRVDWARDRAASRQRAAVKAASNVKAERIDVKGADRAVRVAEKELTKLRRASADTPASDKSAKAAAKAAVRRGEDDLKRAKKALAAEKKQLQRAEDALMDVRAARADARDRVARLDEQTRELQVDVRRGSIREQATSGLSGGLNVVDQMVEQSRNTDLSKAQRAKLATAARAAEKDLTSLYASAEKLDAQIAAATSKAQELQAISDAVSSTLAGEQSLGGSLGQKDEWGYDKPVTAASLVADAQAKAASIKAFAGKLNKLRQMGLTGPILQEIAQLGSTQGGQVADALIAGGTGSVNQLKSAYTEIETWSNKAGQYVTEGFYNGGLQAANGLVAGLQSQQKAIEAQITTIAIGMERALKRALGIASPSKVTTKIGEQTAEGVMVGQRNKLAAIRASASAMAQAAVPGLGAVYDRGSAYSVPSQAPVSAAALQHDLVGAVRAALPEAMKGMPVYISAELGVDRRTAAEIVQAGNDEGRFLGGNS